jgi:hypothetical protein
MKEVHYVSGTVQNRPFDDLSLRLFWPLGVFIAAGLFVWRCIPPASYETCSVAVRFRDTVDSQKKAVSARKDFLPLFWF